MPILIAVVAALLALIALPRSEEHTSELQSRLHLVCRLLLEKKNLRGRTRGPASTYRKRTGSRLRRRVRDAGTPPQQRYSVFASSSDLALLACGQLLR